jgi:hypothetical protein
MFDQFANIFGVPCIGLFLWWANRQGHMGAVEKDWFERLAAILAGLIMFSILFIIVGLCSSPDGGADPGCVAGPFGGQIC